MPRKCHFPDLFARVFLDFLSNVSQIRAIERPVSKMRRAPYQAGIQAMPGLPLLRVQQDRFDAAHRGGIFHLAQWRVPAHERVWAVNGIEQGYLRSLDAQGP